MTFNEIKLRLMTVLNDNLGDVARFTDAHVEEAINQAIKKLIDYAYQSPFGDEIMSSLLVIEESQTVSGGKITLTNTPYAIKSMRRDYFPIKRITSSDIGIIQTDSILGARAIDPYYLWSGGTDVNIYGLPDSTPVHVTYIKQPTFYTDGASPDFPEKFHEFLVWYPAHLLASNVESGYEQYAETFLLKAMEIIGIYPQAQKG